MEGRSPNLKISSKRRQKNQHLFAPDRKEDPPPTNTTWIKIKKGLAITIWWSFEVMKNTIIKVTKYWTGIQPHLSSIKNKLKEEHEAMNLQWLSCWYLRNIRPPLSLALCDYFVYVVELISNIYAGNYVWRNNCCQEWYFNYFECSRIELCILWWAEEAKLVAATYMALHLQPRASWHWLSKP